MVIPHPDANSLILIGLAGKQFSGKTTLANSICEFLQGHGYNPTRMALADPMKDMVKRGLGRADREAWQIFGTEVVRNGCQKYFGHSEFWVNLYLSLVQDVVTSGRSNAILCDDIRFPNELEGLKQAGFRVVRLDAEESTRIERGQSSGKAYLPGHTSELALDCLPDQSFDLILRSDNQSPDQMTSKIVGSLSLAA